MTAAPRAVMTAPVPPAPGGTGDPRSPAPGPIVRADSVRRARTSAVSAVAPQARVDRARPAASAARYLCCIGRGTTGGRGRARRRRPPRATSRNATGRRSARLPAGPPVGRQPAPDRPCATRTAAQRQASRVPASLPRRRARRRRCAPRAHALRATGGRPPPPTPPHPPEDVSPMMKAQDCRSPCPNTPRGARGV